MKTTTLELETAKIEKDAQTAMEAARALVVSTTADFKAADGFCVTLKGIEKQIDDTFDHLIEGAHKQHKALVAEKKKHSEPIIEARKIAKQKMAAYQEAEEQARRAEEARLREIERKRAEDEALRQAAEAENSGDMATAEAIIQAPVEVAPVVLPKAVPKAATTIRKAYKFRVTNAALIPREYLTPDLTKIGGVVRATQGTVAIPGIEIYSEAC